MVDDESEGKRTDWKSVIEEVEAMGEVEVEVEVVLGLTRMGTQGATVLWVNASE